MTNEENKLMLEDYKKWIEEHTKKTWLEEKLSFYDQYCDSEYNEGGKDGYSAGATEVCEKILEELEKHSIYGSELIRDIIKNLGVEV